MNLEQHQVHQALQGGNISPFFHDILFGCFGEPDSILPLENYPQGFALLLIQKTLFPVKDIAVMDQKSKGLFKMTLTEGGSIVALGADIEFTGIDP
jgi:hypothetical protein